ncbi:MAG: PAS domain S-box protein [Candidatus Marinimicrobia bacterium]|nr:PAS domain S-box protein [Candidatus Neomarinimicrobiota bacterium]MCF7827663.1 PAS domain S-box protein [Candidatus Neomarinimicrobiota bacterium]MCF7881282.1 PAS domain S-box protein [Candidatus Neomarinimicrobiota bacterium]
MNTEIAQKSKESLERKLLALKREFQHFKYHLPGAVVEVRLDIENPKVLFINRIAEFVLGFKQQDVEEGLSFWHMVASEKESKRILQLSIEYFGESIFQEKPYDRVKKQELFELHLQRKNGDKFMAEAQTSVRMDENRIPHTIVVVLRDITKRKILERDRENLIEELQEANRIIQLLQNDMELCESCHRIKAGEDLWQTPEEYLRMNTTGDLSLSLCPDCQSD